ncbi:MAG TPA: amidohydrolase family protein, partial [Dehalococcoidia bacterium]|nr:amidohydrolase family protein [Dehalococcoidia bacterium]
FCKEATVTPNVQEALKRMFGGHEPKRREAMQAGIFMYTQRTIQDIIHDMDDAGVEKACIVAMDLSTHYGVELVTNEDVARIASAYPDRFIPFASVDPSMGRLAVDKLVHAVKNLGCRGLKLVPPVQHFDFSDPKHFPLWETALELNIPIWTHASHQISHPDSDARLGHPMLLEPVTLRYPDLRIILGHCGFPWPWDTWSLVVRHANVYVDISAYSNLYNHFPWDAYMKYGLESKILFATDYPMISFKEGLSALKALNLPGDFEKKILGENAIRLLGLR